MSSVPERLGWLTSAGDQAAVDLLRDVLHARIPLGAVVCAAESGPYVGLVQRLCAESETPFLHLPPLRVDTERDTIDVEEPRGYDEELRNEFVKEQRRRTYDENLWRELAHYDCSTLLLVGYRRIVTLALRSRARTILNLHPAPPLGPTGLWQEVIWSLISVRARLAGGMVHIATKKLDRGPVLSYYTIPIDNEELAPLWSEIATKLLARPLKQIAADEGENEPLFRAIRERQFVREAPLLIVTLQRLLDGSLQVVDRAKGGVLYNGTLFPDGVCVTAEVEAIIQQRRG